jgi:hypothetical protein
MAQRLSSSGRILNAYSLAHDDNYIVMGKRICGSTFLSSSWVTLFIKEFRLQKPEIAAAKPDMLPSAVFPPSWCLGPSGSTTACMVG